MDVQHISRIVVVGAGTMGHGIALEFALAGYQVRLHSRTETSLERALRSIRDSLDLLVSLGAVTRRDAGSVPARIQTSADLEESVSDADVVIESVYEDLPLKQRVFRQLDQMCPDRTILASNTSSLMPGKLASATRRPDRVLVAHYVNPPFLVPFVEIVPGGETSDETVAAMSGLLTAIGKRPIVVRKEVPGFVASRLQEALLREALWLVQNGVASPQDVDVAIKTGIGRRWAVAGVFEVLEIAGWDLLEAIATDLFPHLASSPEVPAVLSDMVRRGELGVKTGKGFYEWTPRSAESLKRRIAAALVEIERWPT
jgi:3-hydroxybutyryl-CoA dehydrogenase